MARLNIKTQTNFTAEDAPAVDNLSAEQQLRRSLLSCLLWEREFYEDGQSIADRIEALAEKVKPEVLAALAIEARTQFNLRHAPLMLLAALSKTGRGKGSLIADTIFNTIQRADEMGELLAIYWRKPKDGSGTRKMVPHQMQKGLARAFKKFDEFRLAKYDRDSAGVKLRDVLRLARPKPENDEQSALFLKVKNREMKTPDTWEVALSGGADKKATFERLLAEGQLGYLALLRNLRNMAEAGVDSDLVKRAILNRKGAERVLPFRFIAAARAAMQFERELDHAMLASIEALPKLAGKTIVLVDVSGSMDAKLSARSDLTRADAAAALASIINGDVRTFSFSEKMVECPPRKGMAGVDAILKSQGHGGTYLGAAVKAANTLPHDRLIVITDEQSHDPVGDPAAKNAYMINVASNKNGVGYRRWTHIDGFSENVLRFIAEREQGL